MTLRRLSLTVFSAILAVLVGKDAALAYWRIQDPARAPKAFATDPVLQVRLAERNLPDPAQLSARAGVIAGHARAALRSEPLDAIAMRQLGVVAAVQSAAAGAAYWTTAERISRRDLAGQLLLNELAAQDGDVAAALTHYDRALLTYPAAGEHLYPVLAQALSNPEIRTALTKYADRAWVLDFLGKAIELGSDPADVTGLMAAARVHMPSRDTQRIATMLIGQLVARGQYAAARELAQQIPGSASGTIDQIVLSSATSDTRLAPFTWAFTNEDAFETALDDKGGLDIRVTSERSGIVAQRVTLLAPGQYQFTQVVSYASGTPPATLSWEVRCQGDASSRPIWKQQLPVAEGNTTYRSAFTVPQACAAQSWQLVATAAETQIASTAGISSLLLVKR